MVPPQHPSKAAILQATREEALQGGGKERMEQQHARGKLTARERLDLFLDKGFFTELDMFVRHRARDFGLEDKRPLGDGVATGYGIVNGRQVFVFSHDFTVFGGSLRVTVITRKAYGGAYDVMSSKHIRGDVDLAWPSAEIAVMCPKGAVETLWKRDIQSAENPEALTEKLSQEYREKFANPYISAERGFIDDIILPRRTPPRLIETLTMLETKVDTNPARNTGTFPYDYADYY